MVKQRGSVLITCLILSAVSSLILLNFLQHGIWIRQLYRQMHLRQFMLTQHRVCEVEMLEHLPQSVSDCAQLWCAVSWEDVPKHVCHVKDPAQGYYQIAAQSRAYTATRITIAYHHQQLVRQMVLPRSATGGNQAGSVYFAAT